jgi:polyisoprenoid-binding protein YceI
VRNRAVLAARKGVAFEAHPSIRHRNIDIEMLSAHTRRLSGPGSKPVRESKGITMNAMSILRSTLLISAISLATGAALAQTSSWKIDSAHSGIEFQIRHLGVSTVRGTLAKPAGIVKLDDKDVTKSSVETIIDANTISTNETARDNHLKSAEFFNVAQFSTLTFKSTSLSKVDGKLQMIGDLSLAGVTRPITLILDGPAAPQKGMHGETVSGFSATGTLSRKDFNFGQKYGAPILGDDVKFTIDIEMDKQ